MTLGHCERRCREAEVLTAARASTGRTAVDLQYDQTHELRDNKSPA